MDPRSLDIPKGIKYSLEEYFDRRRPTGSFLHAVLCNDLMNACSRADCYNIVLLPAIMSYIYNNLPVNCYGSPKIVKEWLDGR